jgi:ATP-dependent Clp protease protease subunit
VLPDSDMHRDLKGERPVAASPYLPNSAVPMLSDVLGNSFGAANEPAFRAPSAPRAFGDDEVFQQLRRERILWLAGEVRDEMANRLCGEMLLLSAEDPNKDIYLYVNSPGGSVSAGLAIYDTMQFVKNDIVTVGLGMAASMGQFLLTAGAPGKRYALPNLRVMMHQPLGGLGGVQSLVQKQAEQMMIIKKKLAQLIADHTGRPVEQIVEDSEWEKWFSAHEAQEYGIVDHVVTSAREVAGDGGTA